MDLNALAGNAHKKRRWFGRSNEKLPDFGVAYFRHLAAEYQLLPPPLSESASTATATIREIISKGEGTPKDLTWADIYTLDRLILGMQPDETLVRRTWSLRTQFEEVAGTKAYAQYLLSGVPSEVDTPDKRKALRADLTVLLEKLHWYYSLIPIRDECRHKLTLTFLTSAVVYSIAVVIIFLVLRHFGQDFAAILSGVVYFGVLGGYVSSQKRFQDVSSEGDPLVSIYGLNSARFSLWLSPLMGAIFAGILLLLFVGHIVTGSIFPDFVNCPEGGTGTLSTVCWNKIIDKPESVAKLFVWSFLAGFAERLVPNALDRLVARAGSNDKPPVLAPIGPRSTPGKEPASVASVGEIPNDDGTK